jgi:hypothetical protein
MMGITINTVARRVILSPDATVLETLRRIQLDQIEISKHENITLADLLSEGIPVSDLFRSILNFKNLPGDHVAEDVCSVEDRLFVKYRGGRDGFDFLSAAPGSFTDLTSIQTGLPFCKCRICWSLYPFLMISFQALTADLSSSDSLSLLALYASEMISEAEVKVILDHCEAALLFLVHRPHESIGDATLINAREMQRLVPDTNPAHLPNPVQILPYLIEAQASRTPQKIAVRISRISLIR